jgi:signal transduction histidine kinase
VKNHQSRKLRSSSGASADSRWHSQPQSLCIGAVAVAALVTGLLVSWVLVSSGLTRHPDLPVVLMLDAGWPLIGTGLIWHWLRPATPAGCVMVLVGFLALSAGLAGASSALLQMIGLFGDALALVGLAYLVLTILTGRPTRWGAAEILVIGVAVLAGRAALVLTGGDLQPILPLSRRNACSLDVMISPLATPVHRLVQLIDTYWRLGVSILVVTAVARCFFGADKARRADRAIPALLVVVLMTCLALFEAAYTAGASTRAFGLALEASAFVAPYSFLVSLMVSRARVAEQLASLTTDLASSRSMSDVEHALQTAVHDPSLRLGFSPKDTGGFVDIEGRRIEAEVCPRQRFTELEADGRRMVIIHTVPLPDDRDALAAVAGAARIAADTGHLRAELERSVRELQSSRQRIVETLDASRRQLERDLHDSAQQQLLVARMALGRARERTQATALRESLTSVDDELFTLQEELRKIAQELEPEILRNLGLEAALGWATARLPGRVALVFGALGRYPYPVEAAVYHACLEALQSPLRHLGPAGETRVRLWEGDGRLNFEISDSGSEIDTERLTRGPRMSRALDHVKAVGGHLEVRSASGKGVVVAGRAPIPRTGPDSETYAAPLEQ